jgi:hypothetical protein
VTFNKHLAKKNRRRPKHPIRAFDTSPDATAETLPNDAIPVDSWSEPNKIVIPALVTGIVGAPAPPRSPSTWGGYLRTLSKWEQDLLVSVRILDRSQLLTALRQEDLLFLASDGGARDKKASFGTVIATGDTILAECGGRAEGPDPGSFRAEGYGILAILYLLHHLQVFYVARNRRQRLRLYCDSQSLLLRLEASWTLKRVIPRHFLFSEIDVEMQILEVLRAIESHVTFEHVEGHQDTKYPERPLSWAAQLNMRCDEIATDQLDVASQPIPTVTFLPASQVSISVGAHTLTHHIPTQLRYFSGLAGLREHYCKHHAWISTAIFDLINWPLFHQATLVTTFSRRLFILKWINDLLPFQKQQFRYRQSPTAHCPSAYGCTEEDWRHFSRCPHEQ